MKNSANAHSGPGWTGLVVVAIVLAAAAGWGWAVFSPSFSVFGMVMSPPDGSVMVDPNTPVKLDVVGIGTQFAEIELREAGGTVITDQKNLKHYTLNSPLAFGKSYTVTATVKRPWFMQEQTRVLHFETAAIPILEGGAPQRTLAPDGSLTLRFDRPVGKLEADSALDITVQPDAARLSFRLLAGHYEQNQTYPLRIKWATENDVPLPGFDLNVTVPHPISADANLRGAQNIGSAIPLQITFSEALANREEAGHQIRIATQNGNEISGKWNWISENRLQFTPKSGWPASSTIKVEPTGEILSTQGGRPEPPLNFSFTTGTDRRIFVYLDTQTMVALENGQTVQTFKVSTGKPKTPTVAGSFYIYARFPIKTMKSKAKKGEKGHYIVENVPYAQYFHAEYAFHGAWWHNSFGHPASHGCVNMSTREHNQRWPNVEEEAGWLYRWAALGVPVTVVGATPSPPPPPQPSTSIAME